MTQISQLDKVWINFWCGHTPERPYTLTNFRQSFDIKTSGPSPAHCQLDRLSMNIGLGPTQDKVKIFLLFTIHHPLDRLWTNIGLGQTQAKVWILQLFTMNLCTAQLAPSRPASGPLWARTRPTVGPHLAYSSSTPGPPKTRTWPTLGPQLAHSIPATGPLYSHTCTRWA